MNLGTRGALSRLLSDLFTAAELRRFLRRGPRGDEIARSLPGEQASLDALSDEAVSALCQLGQAGPEFFAALKEERPDRAGDIEEVASSWSPEPSHAGRGRWYFRLEGSFEHVDLEFIARTLEELRKASNDPTLMIRAVGPGSIVVEVDATMQGGEALLRAWREHRLDRLAGLSLLSIDAAPPTPLLRSRFPVPARLTAAAAQQMWELRAPPELSRHAGARGRYHASIAAVAGAGLAMNNGYALELSPDETRSLLDIALLSTVLAITRLAPPLTGAVARVILPLVLDVATLSFTRVADALVASVEAARGRPGPPSYSELPEAVRDNLAPEDYARLVVTCRPGSEAEVSLPRGDESFARTLRTRVIPPQTARRPTRRGGVQGPPT